MRRRYLVAATAALALTAGGTVALAQDTEPESAESTRPARAVTLPTGDAVSISPHGTATWHAAPGREGGGYLLPPALDGSADVIAIPVDRWDEIAAGKEDPRRYNVTELLRSGQYDAAKAKRLSDKDYGAFVPVADADDRAADDAQPVTLTVTDRQGEAAGGLVSYLNPATGDYGELELDDNGQGTVDLAPGRWDFHSTVGGDEIVSGITTANVTDAPVEITADGTEAVPVEYTTERPATAVDQMVLPFTTGADGSTYGIGSVFGEDITGYVIPTTDDQTDTGIEAVPHLIGTDTSDPYTYDLNFFLTDGIPADLNLTVEDEELAQVERTFDGLITTEPTTGCNNVLREGGTDLAMCPLLPLEWQTTRTEYLTPGADLTWYANATIGDLDSSDEFIDIESEAKFEAGPAEAVTGSAPVAFNVGGEYEEPVLTRDGDTLVMYLPYMDNADTAEVIEDFHAVEGTAVLERDGEELARTDLTFPMAEFTLPEGDSGTYTLTAEVNRSTEVSPLAATTEVAWQFASEPTTEATPLDVSAVGFDAEGVSGGYADASQPQKFTLDFAAQEGATDTELAELGFEVSYDDGQTWNEVDITVDGDGATGELQHPEGATFVSVRATATDDAGNTVTHSTVAAYGLT